MLKIKKQSKVVKKAVTTELKALKKIMSKYIMKEYVDINKKQGTAFCPLGMFIYLDEDDLWLFSIEYNWMEDGLNEVVIEHLTLMQYIIRDASLILNRLEFDSGSYTVYTDDGEYVDLLMNEDIFKYMQKEEVNYSTAKIILSSRMVVEYEEKMKELEENKK